MERTNGAASEVERVTDLLRAEVLDGSRPPGSKLVERDLAEELGVSRVPVRDALKALAAEGLVTLRPRTWAVVSEFSAEDIADLTEVRQALEGLAFRLAAQRRTEEGLTRLRAVVDDEAAAAHRDDAARARRSAAAFHEVVFDLAGNRLLSEVEALTRSRMRRFHRGRGRGRGQSPPRREASWASRRAVLEVRCAALRRSTASTSPAAIAS